MGPEDADGLANSVDPDQTVWSGFTPFAKTCLSENLGSLRYHNEPKFSDRLVWINSQGTLWSVSTLFASPYGLQRLGALLW